MFFSKRLFTTFVLLTSLISCGKKDISKIEKPTELKGYVEYLKKIKENPDGNNYYAGYKEVELRKMINKQRSVNQFVFAFVICVSMNPKNKTVCFLVNRFQEQNNN